MVWSHKPGLWARNCSRHLSDNFSSPNIRSLEEADQIGKGNDRRTGSRSRRYTQVNADQRQDAANYVTTTLAYRQPLAQTVANIAVLFHSVSIRVHRGHVWVDLSFVVEGQSVELRFRAEIHQQAHFEVRCAEVIE